MESAPENLDAWLEYISRSHPSEIELGLDRVKEVYRKMDFSALPNKVVVVAGTNGKGSTIALTAAGLSSLGYKCGAYTSPHILKYNERVNILGSDASDQDLIEAFSYVERVRRDVPLTYFEFGTLAALYILFNAGLDVVLLEIGLGGRLDAVNIVEGDVSVITSVDIDHVDWLGDDIQQIGREKAGILRSGQTFLAGENLPRSVFERASDLNCELVECRKDFDQAGEGYYVSDNAATELKFDNFPQLDLPENNILLALQLIYILSGSNRFDHERVLSSLSKIRLAGRIEQYSKIPYVYFDVGHNPHAARFLAKFLAREKLKGRRVEVVFSALADKDIGGVVETIGPCVDLWRIFPLDVYRAIPIEELESKVRAHTAEIVCYESIGEALDKSLEKNMQQTTASATANDRLVLVFGSFFTVEAAKKYLERYE